MQTFKCKVTCPRWALPAEEVPIHVQFDKSLTPLLQSVNVTLHESLAFKDFINLTDYYPDGQTLTINSIGKSTRSEYDYFGFAVATTSPFEELKKMVPIKIKFNYHDGSSETYTEYARIFRPLLELGESPDSIMITDKNANRLELPIALKFSGFGQIKIKTECKMEGRIVSYASSMLTEIIRKIAQDGIAPADGDHDTSVSVNPDYVEQTATQISELLQSRDGLGKILNDLGNGGGGGDYANTLRELGQESREKFMGILCSTVETYVTQVIADILSRNVGANLAMEPTRIHTQINLPVTKVIVRLFYKDLVGNVYAPVVKHVEIVDKRKSPVGLDVKIPLSVKSVDESGAYKNVSTMEISVGE